MPESLIERYLTDMGEVRGTRSNVPETSFYPALERLLSDIGKSLSPKVRCVINLANRGAGLPDGGLFSADQFRRKTRDADAKENPFLVQNPSRGVIEAKPPAEDVRRMADTGQVERYWKRYGMVLVTNFRAFALIGKGPTGQPCVLESFTLAESESEFWRLTDHPRRAAAEHGERMLEYLKRVLLHNAPLAAPQDVAGILASYARDAHLRIDQADLPALTSLRQALEDALGLRFEGEKGEHFFRSTLIQTLFYGVFSAWVLWARRRDAKPSEKTGFADALRDTAAPYAVAGGFDWRVAPYLLRVPMLRALFVQVADPARLGALGLIEVLDWTAAALNRVDRAEFFRSFDEGHAVQYFYEPFLHAFDPDLRKELGVWYTPEEIVRYQVERVDAVLRSELGLADGLADPNVVVLDPCCGTGAYLRAVLRRIAVTLHDKGGDALVANDLKKAAMERVFGFEILPAPFVIAHLQLGLELETLGAPLSDRSDPPERAGVYLTNALTGWEPPREKPKQIAFPGFDDERDAAGRVKQEKPILVILGNPPYNGYAGMAMDEERDLSTAYRTAKKVAAPQGQGLNDLYVRFFRMAERRIVEKNGQGIICFISNYSWLDGLSFTGMRERYLDVFDTISIDCLNGDKYKTGKLTPDGQPDPSVFSTEFNHEGIQVGTAITLLVKVGANLWVAPCPRPEVAGHQVQFRHFWGKTKRAELLAGLGQYETLTPALGMGLSLMPGQVATGYLTWSLLPKLFPVSFPGVQTKQDGLLTDIERVRLEKRMLLYFDTEVSDEELKRQVSGSMDGTDACEPRSTRAYLLKRGYLSQYVVRYAFRPFDCRWLYWEPETKLLGRKVPEYFPNVFPGNLALVSQQKPRRDWAPPQVISILGCLDLMDRSATCFPLYLRTTAEHATLLEKAGHKPNLSETAAQYLGALKATPEDLFYHTLAILHASAYRTENAGALRQGWPRIPLPQAKDSLLASAALGRQVAALLDTEAPVPGVTAGTIQDELRGIAVFQRVDGKPAKPEAGDLDLTAGWGHAGKGGVTMPGKGKLIRRDDGACNIFLNDDAFWRNVPGTVWDYTIGGYQVIKKWLSYREKPLLGRGLTPDEVRYVTEMARRLTALIALQSCLDDNYRNVIRTTYPWTNK
ncbi:MAG: N-6 DNA methylase [Deltaproteobacteria bacterium]|nr:N-6 DNA methylase [Deltaproteobacteria bacterium]